MEYGTRLELWWLCIFLTAVNTKTQCLCSVVTHFYIKPCTLLPECFRFGTMCFPCYVTIFYQDNPIEMNKIILDGQQSTYHRKSNIANDSKWLKLYCWVRKYVNQNPLQNTLLYFFCCCCYQQPISCIISSSGISIKCGRYTLHHIQTKTSLWYSIPIPRCPLSIYLQECTVLFD